MMSLKRKFSIFFLSLLFLLLGANFVFAAAPEIFYPSLPFTNIEPPQVFMEKIEKGEIPKEQALSLYVKYFYSLTVMVCGLIILGALFYGGFKYLISAGNPSEMVDAKDWITSAVLGLIVLLSSYIFLVTINPQLAVFSIFAPELEKCRDCDCSTANLSSYCKACCMKEVNTTIQGDVYYEIPLGRIIERVIKKADEARITAEKTKAAAEILKNKTDELNRWLHECNCSAVETICTSDGSCQAVSCGDKNPPEDRPCPHWKRIDELLNTHCSAPSDPPITIPSSPYGCFFYFGNGDDQEGICSCMSRTKENGDPECYGEHAGCCPMHAARPICGWTDCNPARCDTPPADDCGGLWIIGGGPAGGPICTVGEIPGAISSLNYWRGKSIEAKLALNDEYVSLQLAEDLLRSSMPYPVQYESFIAISEIEGDTVKKTLNRWSSIDITSNPLNSVIESEDPATFYIQEEGNETIINAANSVAYGSIPSMGPPAQPGWTPPPGAGSPPPANLDSVEDFAKYASVQTGVRASLILAMLYSESGYNQFAGSGNYPDDFCCPKSSWWQENNCDNFEDIWAEVGSLYPDYTLTTVPVSAAGMYCSEGECHESCGGAMGAAQAMPYTWLSYKDEIKTITGNTIASPWNLQHAFLFTGLFLKSKGADSQLCEDEANAAHSYMGGFIEHAYSIVANANNIADEIGENHCYPGAQPPATGNFPPPKPQDAGSSPDLNPNLKGYHLADSSLKTLVPTLDPDGVDQGAPRIDTVLNGTPSVKNVYALNSPTEWEQQWPVHLIGLSTTPGENIKVPDSGYSLTDGYEAIVLYADENSITLKYTEDNNVERGYTIQIQNIQVSPAVLNGYRENAYCPAYMSGAILGTAAGDELIVAIRDTGAWMDPRWREDWWQ